MDTLVQKCYFYCNTPRIYENGNPLKYSLIYSISPNIKEFVHGAMSDLVKNCHWNFYKMLLKRNVIVDFGDGWCFSLSWWKFWPWKFWVLTRGQKFLTDPPPSSIAHKTKHQPPKYDQTTHPSITTVENNCLLFIQDELHV